MQLISDDPLVAVVDMARAQSIARGLCRLHDQDVALLEVRVDDLRVPVRNLPRRAQHGQLLGDRRRRKPWQRQLRRRGRRHDRDALDAPERLRRLRPLRVAFKTWAATITYSATANDRVDGTIAPSCSPASGTLVFAATP